MEHVLNMDYGIVNVNDKNTPIINPTIITNGRITVALNNCLYVGVSIDCLLIVKDLLFNHLDFQIL